MSAEKIRILRRKRRRFFVLDLDMLEICIDLAEPLADHQEGKPVTAGVCKAGAAVLGWVEEKTNWILNSRIADINQAFEEAQAALEGRDTGQLWHRASFKEIVERDFFNFFARSTVISAIQYVEACGFLERRLPDPLAGTSEPTLYRMRADRVALAITLVREARLASEWCFDGPGLPADGGRPQTDSPDLPVDVPHPQADEGGLQVIPLPDRRQHRIGPQAVKERSADGTPIDRGTAEEAEPRKEQLSPDRLEDLAKNLAGQLAELVTARTHIRTEPDASWVSAALEVIDKTPKPELLPELIRYSQQGNYWPRRIVTMTDFANHVGRIAGEYHADRQGGAPDPDLDADVA